jgi:hypothetical protein
MVAALSRRELVVGVITEKDNRFIKNIISSVEEPICPAHYPREAFPEVLCFPLFGFLSQYPESSLQLGFLFLPVSSLTEFIAGIVSLSSQSEAKDSE